MMYRVLSELEVKARLAVTSIGVYPGDRRWPSMLRAALNNGGTMTAVSDRKIMGTPEQAREALLAKAREWRDLRQPVMGTKKELRALEVREHNVRFELANAALHWLWHQENQKKAEGVPRDGVVT